MGKNADLFTMKDNCLPHTAKVSHQLIPEHEKDLESLVLDGKVYQNCRLTELGHFLCY